MRASTELSGRTVTRGQVLAAIEKLRQEPPRDDWLANQAHKFALVHDGDLYPPKRVLSIATGLPVAKFSGGVGHANRVLEELGFTVVPKADAAGYRRS